MEGGFSPKKGASEESHFKHLHEKKVSGISRNSD
jgi:hypothetical protein